jgi:hypothetical protein
MYTGFFARRVLHPDHHLLLDARARAVEAFAALGRRAEQEHDATDSAELKAKVSEEVCGGWLG